MITLSQAVTRPGWREEISRGRGVRNTVTLSLSADANNTTMMKLSRPGLSNSDNNNNNNNNNINNRNYSNYYSNYNSNTLMIIFIVVRKI